MYTCLYTHEGWPRQVDSPFQKGFPMLDLYLYLRSMYIYMYIHIHKAGFLYSDICFNIWNTYTYIYIKPASQFLTCICTYVYT